MRKILFTALSSVVLFVYTGCGGSIEEYKPLSQVKPVKQTIPGETKQ